MPNNYGAAFLAGITGFMQGLAKKKLMQEAAKSQATIADFERQRKEKEAELELLSKLAKIPEYQKGVNRLLSEKYGINVDYTPPEQPSVAQQGLEMFSKMPASAQQQLLQGLGITEPPPDVTARAEFWREKAQTERTKRQRQQQINSKGKQIEQIDPQQAVGLPFMERVKLLKDINNFLTDVGQYYDLTDQKVLSKLPGVRNALYLQNILVESLQREVKPPEKYIPFSPLDPEHQQRIIEGNKRKKPIQWVK